MRHCRDIGYNHHVFYLYINHFFNCVLFLLFYGMMFVDWMSFQSFISCTNGCEGVSGWGWRVTQFYYPLSPSPITTNCSSYWKLFFVFLHHLEWRTIMQSEIVFSTKERKRFIVIFEKRKWNSVSSAENIMESPVSAVLRSNNVVI